LGHLTMPIQGDEILKQGANLDKVGENLMLWHCDGTTKSPFICNGCYCKCK
jgi:hypothetical protein